MSDYIQTTGMMMPGDGFSNPNFGRTPLDDLPLAMAYVPMQKLCKLYEPELGLETGTMFPELDKPWIGSRW